MDETLMKLSIDEKIAKSKEVIAEGLDRFDRLVIAFTGGKDSTLLLWLFKHVCDENSLKLPECMFIDEGYVFEEILEFVAELEELWGLTVHRVQNTDVIKNVNGVGDIVRVRDLNPRNRAELLKLDFDGEEFPFEPESYIGNHLMKTVAMNMFIEENHVEALATGIRWDEQDARKDEVFFSPRYDPDHVRVHPILHFTERDVWEVTRKYGIPTNKLYAQGYRSLGAKGSTSKKSDVPAWEQNLEETVERAGRRQDKEGIMKRLRDLGYM
jgi:phosphoadenosine phosphosulfate reductase